MRTKNLIFLLAVIMLCLIAFILHVARYSIYPTPNGDIPSAYKLDRWTGTITYLHLRFEDPMKKD